MAYKTYLQGILDTLVTTGYTVNIIEEQSYKRELGAKEIGIRIKYLSASKLYRGLSAIKQPIQFDITSEQGGYAVAQLLMQTFVNTYTKTEISLSTTVGETTTTTVGEQMYFGPSAVNDFIEDDIAGYRTEFQVTGYYTVNGNNIYTSSFVVDTVEIVALNPRNLYNTKVDSNILNTQTNWTQENVVLEGRKTLKFNVVDTGDTFCIKVKNLMRGYIANSGVYKFAITQTFSDDTTISGNYYLSEGTLTETTADKIGIFDLSFVEAR